MFVEGECIIWFFFFFETSIVKQVVDIQADENNISFDFTFYFVQ